MFFDLNVPIPSIGQSSAQGASKKGKGRQQALGAASVAYTASQINSVEARIDVLVRLGYTVIGFNQLVYKKVEPKSHVNTLGSLVSQLRERPGTVFLKRLSIILDEDSEKGFGLTNANAALFTGYDLLSLIPTTQATFSLACLTHTMPSPLTAHIISLPLTLPRLSFYLKHTLVRTAIKNGAVFEISYVGALGGENDSALTNAGAAENGPTAKRNWWAAAREIVRVTKGKNVIVSGGVVAEADFRPPRDVANLITLLGLAQDASHSSLTDAPKSLVVRAQTRKTYRAVLSEPKLVIPQETQTTLTNTPSIPPSEQLIEAVPSSPRAVEAQVAEGLDLVSSSAASIQVSTGDARSSPKKRGREEGEPEPEANPQGTAASQGGEGESRKKKKRKKNKGMNIAT